jgi:GTP pyrophosphokinase
MLCGSAAVGKEGDTTRDGSPTREPLVVRLHVTPDELWQEELDGHLGHLQPREVAEVRRGLQIAYDAHDGQKRKSGEPYIIHPVAVARILADLKLDRESIIAGLLHDTVEDTDRVTFESIEAEFGPAVRRIVEGETKVSKVTGKLRNASEAAAEAAAAVSGDSPAGRKREAATAAAGELPG